MDIKQLLSHVDHTLLSVDCTEKQILTLCDEGIKYGTASVCIPPFFVETAAHYVDGRVPICTVVGFPNGYCTANVKAYEAGNAVSNGAAEIDMVINVAALKSRNFSQVERDIAEVRSACEGKVLKVIIEACLLTDEEKRLMCDICASVGADYIKTSTGFSVGGATVEDVRLLSSCCKGGLKVKAAGGISTLEQAEALLNAGATRLGTSRLVRLAREAEGV